MENKKLIELFRKDLKDICEDNQIQDEIDLYFNDKLKELEKPIIKITVEGGVVTDVENLPDGWLYEINDKDMEKHK